MSELLKQLAALDDVRAALGSALSLEQQLFVSAHMLEFAAWLRTDAGREAARLVVDEWRGTVK